MINLLGFLIGAIYWYGPQMAVISPLLWPWLRVLIATDVLSEGQNLQDCHIVVNYDLPWDYFRRF